MKCSESPRISVVIPSYRRSDSVLALLSDIFQQRGVEFEVIVVDDCSPDGSADAVAVEFPQVHLLRNEVNSGPCVSRNRGILAARGEFIVGLDSDVRVPDSALLRKIQAQFEKDRQATGFAFRLLKPDGVTEDRERWWHPVPIERFSNRQFETSYFSGTAYAFRREALIAAGLFPHILFMHLEENGVAFRIIDNGGIIHYRPELCVEHHEHKVARRSEVKVFYRPRNHVLIMYLYYPVVRGLLYVLPRLGYALWTALKNRHLFSFFRAMRSAVGLTAACWKERKPLKPQTWRRIAAFRHG